MGKTKYPGSGLSYQVDDSSKHQDMEHMKGNRLNTGSILDMLNLRYKGDNCVSFFF